MKFALVTTTVIIIAWGQAQAQAASFDPSTTRALGMGGALRGAATGEVGPVLNPSGMSLLRTYIVEAAYQHTGGSDGDSNVGHLAIVDSTSNFGLAGGLTYSYVDSQPTGGGGTTTGHLAGAALSLPLGDRLYVGGTLRYLRLTTEAPAADPTQAAARTSGFTFDLGATVRPFSGVTLGIVGYGLRDLKTSWAPFAAGGGVSLVPVTDLVLTFDTVLDFTTYAPARDNPWSFMGGADYLVGKKFAIRAGGGRQGYTENDYVAGGFSAVSELGALDVGVRHDVSGVAPSTFVGISLRLFVPTPSN